MTLRVLGVFKWWKWSCTTGQALWKKSFIFDPAKAVA